MAGIIREMVEMYSAPIPLNQDDHNNGVYEFELNSEQRKLDVREPYVFRNKFFMFDKNHRI